MVIYVFLRVVHELCSDHDAGDEEAVDVKRSETNAGSLDESFYVNVCNHKARCAAACILKDTFHVLSDAHAGCFRTIKHCYIIIL